MNPSITPADDELVFVDENSAHGGSADSEHPHVWRVMIIDDDEDVHSSTTFALSSLEIQHRPLAFLHAYSAAQAREILAHESDVAVILPELVVRHWWENLLHNQRVQMLKLLLLLKGNQRIVVINIPWYL